MTISEESGIKFFTDSKALFRDGATAAASTGTVSQNYILNFNKAFAWSSVGSDDNTVETITITLPVASTIDRLFMIGHNFYDYHVTYNGGNNFANVKSMGLYQVGNFADESGNLFVDESGNIFSDGFSGSIYDVTAQEISATGYAKNTSYYEFDSVSVTTIEITVQRTQVADTEKTMQIFAVCEELGTFSNSGLTKSSPNIDQNERVISNILNKPFVRKGIESFNCSIRIPYSSTQADIDLLELLQEREDDFIIWLCGGHFGSNFYRVDKKPWRLEDVYRGQNTRNASPSFYQDSYLTGINDSLNIVEVA